MRGQANYIDFIIAFGLFLIIIFLFIGAMNALPERLRADDPKQLSTVLLGEGIPAGWTQSTYYRVGITSNDHINETKYAMLADLVENDQETLKSSLNVHGDFMLRIAEHNGSSLITIPIGGINEIATGDHSFARPPETSDVRRVKRVSAYNGSPVVVELVTWREP